MAKPIAGQYIVTVKEGHDPSGIARAIEAKPLHVYTSALNGFAAQLNDGQLTALRHNPSVEMVEQDAEVSATTTQFMDAAGEPWGPIASTRASSRCRSPTRTPAPAPVCARTFSTRVCRPITRSSVAAR